MTKTNKNKIAILGIPFDEYSSFLQGAAEAPSVIRSAYFSKSSNLFTENNIDLSAQVNLSNVGDMQFAPATDPLTVIKDKVYSLLSQQNRVLSLGGDHSITYPIMQAYSKIYPHLNIIQLDAHPDLYDEYQGNRFSHACPFARIKEENIGERLIQIGIRNMTSHLQEQADKFGVEIFSMSNWQDFFKLKLSRPTYLSVDIDVLDPAFAPGVSHPEPGGLTTREVIKVIQQIKGAIVGADIVEFNPTKDYAGLTAVTAAKLMKEILARMLE